MDTMFKPEIIICGLWYKLSHCGFIIKGIVLIVLTHEDKSLTCEEEEDEDHNHGVSKVEDGAGSSDYLQLREEVMHSVDKQIDCCETAG